MVFSAVDKLTPLKLTPSALSSFSASRLSLSCLSTWSRCDSHRDSTDGADTTSRPVCPCCFYLHMAPSTGFSKSIIFLLPGPHLPAHPSLSSGRPFRSQTWGTVRALCEASCQALEPRSPLLMCPGLSPPQLFPLSLWPPDMWVWPLVS